MSPFRNSLVGLLATLVPGLAFAEAPRVLIPPMTPQEQPVAAGAPSAPAPPEAVSPAPTAIQAPAQAEASPVAPMAPAETFVPPEPSDPFAVPEGAPATASVPTPQPQQGARQLPWEQRPPRGVSQAAPPAQDVGASEVPGEAVPAGEGTMSQAPVPIWRQPERPAPPGDPAVPENSRNTAAGGGLALSPLAPPSLAAVGLIDPAHGGFADSLWSGTAEAEAIRLVAALPLPAVSPAAGGLARRLLLTRASAPAGGAGDDRPGEALLAARLDRLIAGGLLAEATRLAALARIGEGGDALALGAARADLLAGDVKSACAYAKRTGADESGRAFFGKLRALCFLDQGNLQAARVQADLLGEQGLAAPVFVASLTAVQYPREPLPQTAAAGEVGAPELALLRRTGRAAPPGLFAAAEPAILRALALDSASEFRALRLGAGEAAFFAGAMSDAEFRALAERSVAVAPSANDGDASEMTGALLQSVRALLAMPATSERPIALAGLLTSTRDPGRYVRLARLFAGDVAGLAPDRLLAPAALELSRVALLSGDAKSAQGFAELFEVAPYTGDRVASQPTLRTDLSLLVHVTSPEFAGDWRLSTASEALNAADLGQASGPRVALALTLLDALGYRLPPEVSLRLAGATTIAGSQATSPYDLAALRSAGEAGRVGETVARALAVVGPTGPWALGGEALATVVRALKAAGLEAEARAIATEALVAQGLGAARG